MSDEPAHVALDAPPSRPVGPSDPLGSAATPRRRACASKRLGGGFWSELCEDVLGWAVADFLWDLISNIFDAF